MKEGRNIARLVLVIAFAVMFFIVTVPTAKTYPPFVSKAKSLGFPANNCTYCHINAAGGAPYNARGKWLITEKDKRSAGAVDVAWLKEFKSGGKPAPKRRTKAGD